MKILYAAPTSFHKYTYFISQFVMGLAGASKQAGHNVRIVQTTENMYNPFVWKFIEKEFQVARHYFRYIFDIPHDLLLMLQIYREVLDFKPDVLFIHLLDTTYFPSIINKIKKHKCKVVAWLGVHPSKVSKGVNSLLRKADCTLIYDESYLGYFEDLNIGNVKVISLGCDDDFYDSIAPASEFKKDCQAGVSFIGYIDPLREKYLRNLTGLDLGIWTWNPESLDKSLKKYYRGEVFGKEMVNVIKSSKVVINIHREYEINGGNLRLFEIPACGALQLVDNKKNIDKYFTIGKEIVTFNDEADMRNKVEYYLDHESERIRIADAGYKRFKKDHTLMNRMEEITDIIENIQDGFR